MREENGQTRMEPVRKRAFPGWLRAIDPFLAKEDENLLFQFFRERRARGRRWEWRMLAPPAIILCALLVSCLHYYFRVVAQNDFLAVAIIIVAVIPGMILFFHYVGAKRTESRSRFPCSVRGFIPFGGLSVPAVEDLWLAGVNGREIGESWALEWAGYAKRLGFFLAPCPPLVAFVLFRHADPLLMGATLTVALLLSLYAVLSVVYAGAWAVYCLLDVLLKYTSFRRLILKGSLDVTVTIVSLAIIAFLLWFSIGAPIARFWREEPFMNPFELSQASGDLAWLLVTAAVALAVVFFPARRWILNWREKSLRKAGPLFEELIQKLQEESEASDAKTRQSVPVASAPGWRMGEEKRLTKERSHAGVKRTAE